MLSIIYKYDVKLGRTRIKRTWNDVHKHDISVRFIQIRAKTVLTSQIGFLVGMGEEKKILFIACEKSGACRVAGVKDMKDSVLFSSEQFELNRAFRWWFRSHQFHSTSYYLHYAFRPKKGSKRGEFPSRKFVFLKKKLYIYRRQ